MTQSVIMLYINFILNLILQHVNQQKEHMEVLLSKTFHGMNNNHNSTTSW